MKRYVFFCTVIMLGTGFGFADIVVLKNGQKMEIDGAFEVKGRFVVFTDLQGELRQLPVSAVDVDKSRQVTEEAVAKREAAAAAAAKKQPPKDVGSLADIVNHVQKTNGGRERGVTISNDGLEKYNETHQRVINDTVADSGGSPSGDAGEGGEANEENAEGGPPTVEQLADPKYRAEKREELQKRHGELSNEVSELDEKIKEMEYMRDVNASSAAFGADNFADGDSADPDTSVHHDQMEKAEKQLEELKKQRAEKEGELTGLDKEAKQNGMPNYTGGTARPSVERKATTGDDPSRYSDDGKRKSLYQQAERKKSRKDKAEEEQEGGADRYDENGKRKKINN